MLKLRARSSPDRPAFSFETSPPPSEDAPGPFPRPPGEFLPERDMHMYGAQPVDGEQFEPGRSLVRCPRCSRTVLEWASADHKREFYPLVATATLLCGELWRITYTPLEGVWSCIHPSMMLLQSLWGRWTLPRMLDEVLECASPTWLPPRTRTPTPIFHYVTLTIRHLLPRPGRHAAPGQKGQG